MQSLTIKLDMVADIKNASFKLISLNVIFDIHRKGTGLFCLSFFYLKRPKQHLMCALRGLWVIP